MFAGYVRASFPDPGSGPHLAAGRTAGCGRVFAEALGRSAVRKAGRLCAPGEKGVLREGEP
jgi:hypothetical protein